MSEPIITSSYSFHATLHRCNRPETIHTKDVEQIPQSDGQNDDDTLVPVGRDEYDDDGATITQVDSSVMCEVVLRSQILNIYSEVWSLGAISPKARLT
jgi:hypothetical protein